MEPLSLAHVAALDALKSPFLTDAPASYRDLIIAAIFCAHPAGKFPRFDSWWFWLKFHIWAFRAKRLKLDEEAVSMRQFIMLGLFDLGKGIQAAQGGAK